jgi:hypothetical protein
VRRDDYRRVLVVASAAALTDVLLKSPHAHVVEVSFNDPDTPPAPIVLEEYRPTKSARTDRDKPWRRWPVRR